MQRISAFLQLIRLPNLLMLALLMVLIRYFLTAPVLYSLYKVSLPLSDGWFVLYALAVLLISAGGYVINDYFDLRIDRINKPHKMIIGRRIHRRAAILWHLIFSFTGLFAGFAVSFKVQNFSVAIIFFLSVLILWFYSSVLKKWFLAGNVVISILTALIPLLAFIIEISMINVEFPENRFELREVTYAVLVLSSFAFLLTLIREIIKDAEDLRGDREAGCSTLPVVLGVERTRWIVFFLILLTIFFALWLASEIYVSGEMDSLFYYGLLFVILPLILLSFIVLRARNEKAFHSASLISKAIMIAGIFGLVVMYLSYENVI